MFLSCKPKSAGVRLAVVSNFDTRLRPLLAAMQLDRLFDAIFISAVITMVAKCFVAWCSLQSCLPPSWVVGAHKALNNDSGWLHVT